MTVPRIHPAYWGILAPTMNHGSKVPSPVLAAAHEASTVVIANAARDSARPRSDGASATPMARYRAFSNRAAAIAAPVPPPAFSTANAPNCAAPEKTTTDMTIGATQPITGLASTPNEMAIANTAMPNGTPRRIPARRLVQLSLERSDEEPAVTTRLHPSQYGRVEAGPRVLQVRGLASVVLGPLWARAAYNRRTRHA